MFEVQFESSSNTGSEDDEYESPNGSKWVVAIDTTGFVTILKAPNIHPSFFDCGACAEDIGLPFDVCDTAPGVYEWTCNYSHTVDWESGLPDDHEFDVTAERLLYAPDNDVETIVRKQIADALRSSAFMHCNVNPEDVVTVIEFGPGTLTECNARKHRS